MPSGTLSLTISVWERFRRYKNLGKWSTDAQAITRLLDSDGFEQ